MRCLNALYTHYTIYCIKKDIEIKTKKKNHRNGIEWLPFQLVENVEWMRNIPIGNDDMTAYLDDNHLKIKGNIIINEMAHSKYRINDV